MGMHLKHRSLFLLRCLRNAFQLLQKNDPLRLAGATAFFANFAIPMILIILIRLFGFFTDRRTLFNNIFSKLSGMLDDESILQIRQTLVNIRNVQQSGYIALISFIFFLFVATTLFAIIKNSVDQIWKIKAIDKPGFLFNMKLRFRSVIIILLAGILFFAGLLADSIQVFIASFIQGKYHSFKLILTAVFNQMFFVVAVTIWFSILFRFLANGRPSWEAAIKGGLLTGILFTLGKYILRILLPLSNIGTIYGSAGSIIVIMLFIFYSALIFFYGAAFVKAFSDAKSMPIIPKKNAYSYEFTKVEE